MWHVVRTVGVLAALVGTALFIAGSLTDHWVDGDNGHWGLWEICDYREQHNATANATMNATIAWTTEMPGLGHGLGIFKTTMRTKEKEEKNKKKDEDNDDEDESCLPISITSIPAFFHITRAIMVLANIVLVWGVLSGRSLHFKRPRGDSFFETHQSEILGCVACGGAILALMLFTDNYDSFHNDTFPNSHLSWSISLVRSAIYIYIPAAILMMSESLHEKYNDCTQSRSLDCSFSDLCFKKSQSRRSATSTARERSSNSNHLEIASNDSIRRNSFLDINSANDDSTTRMAEVEGGLVLNNSFQLSETDSDIFTVTVSNDSDVGRGGDTILPSTVSDLPQYEDVARPEDVGPSSVPPPPSYEDVISGGYLAFSPSTAPYAPPPPPPPFTPSSSSSETSSDTSSLESSATSSGTLPPPPAYQFSDSHV